MTTSPDYARKCVWLRDLGVCANCGVDTEKLQRELRFLTETARIAKMEELGFHPNRALWEADHILEVRDGGGLAQLGNYQTLCYPCHIKKSARNA